MSGILIFAVFAAALGVGARIAMLPTQDPKQTKVNEQHDKSTYPIADYDSKESADLNMHALRRARAKRHNIQLGATVKVDVRRLMLTEQSNSSWGGPPSHAAVEQAQLVSTEFLGTSRSKERPDVACLFALLSVTSCNRVRLVLPLHMEAHMIALSRTRDFSAVTAKYS